MLLLFWCAVGVVAYVYVGYPLVLQLLVAIRGARPVRRGTELPTVSLIISAFNEASVIRRKLENALALDYPADKLQIVVISDSSSDETDDIVRSFGGRVELFRQPERRGKTAGLNRVVPQLRGDIVVFSDANAMYERDSVRMLVRNFADPGVGCVTGEARYLKGDQSTASVSERLYWSYEIWIKRLETDAGSMVGGDGAIYGIRRSLWRQLPENAINDFLNPLQIVAAGHRAVYEPGTEALSVLDSSAGEAWYWVADVARIPFWDRASPMRQMLFWWLETRGYLQVHGSAVGTASGGVLLVGRRGSGKSVTSLASLGSTLLFAADDYVAVSMDGAPRLASIYSSGKLVPEQGRKLLPHLMPLASNPDRLDTEKAVIFAHEHFSTQTTAGFPLRAILVPMVRPTQRESRIVDISRAAAFAALAPSTIVQLRTAGQDELTVLTQLVAQVPSYGIELGTDTGAIAGTIGDLLAGLARSAES